MNQNLFNFKNRRYIITGAASGIGRSTAFLLSSLGASLLLIDINEKELKETKKKCGNSSKILLLNLINSIELKTQIINSATIDGKFDGLVHCAGLAYISPLKTIQKFKTIEIFELNSYAALELSQIFTNRKVYNGFFGSIVFISSVYGCVGSSANAGYAMSKSAINGLTKALAIELAPKSIRVNCIAPGFVKTDMMTSTTDSFSENRYSLLNTLHPLGLGNPEDVANPIAFLLSDGSKWITGAIINVDGGFTAQ